MTDLVAPQVNLNGSSKEELLAGYLTVIERLDDLLAALGKVRPNGRDYPHERDKNLPAAVDAWEERVRQLETLRREVSAVGIAINDQNSI